MYVNNNLYFVGNLLTEMYFFKKKFSSMYAWRIECLSSLFAFGFVSLRVAFPPPHFRPFDEQYSFWSVHNFSGILFKKLEQWFVCYRGYKSKNNFDIFNGFSKMLLFNFNLVLSFISVFIQDIQQLWNSVCIVRILTFITKLVGS